MDPELSALTTTAATTVVQLLATAAWERATSAVGGLWRRVHPERAETVQAELEGSRAELLAAQQVGDEQVEQALVGEWQGRLRRLVVADPQLVGELRRVVAELRSALADVDPPQGATITMQASTFGNRLVNQTSRDLRVSTGEWSMGSSGEQAPKLPMPEPAGNPVRLKAHTSGQVRINQAGQYPHRPHQDGVLPATSGYNAFISYSHALDGTLAPALQTGLERFAKPWYRPRALRVFRDTTNLTANPGLWSSIEKALDASAWLILMASPEAARSKWVNREVAWWLENKSPQRLLVVLTGGEFAWAEDTGDDDGVAAALPPALRGAFVEEPRWVDLRWLRNVGQVDQSNPRLRECVADVAAAVHEVDKDELVGEHIRQHRRTVRLARGGVTTLAVLLIVALVAAGVAFQQRATAQRERDTATFNQTTAIFNRITTQADRLRSTDVSLAAQLYLTAHRMRPDAPDPYTALITLGNTPLSTPLMGQSDPAFSPDGHTLATTSADRTVRLWNLTDPAHPTPLDPPLTGHIDGVNLLAFSPDGQILASGSNDKTVRLWNVTDPIHPVSLGHISHTSAVNEVAFSPDGDTLATGSVDGSVLLWNVTDAAAPTLLGRIDHTSWVGAVAFSPDGHTLASGGGDNTVRLWNVTDPARPIPLDPPLTGHGWVNAVVFSPDGRILASGGADQNVRLWNVTDPAHPIPLGQPLTGHTNWVKAVAFSPDGHTLASGGGDPNVRLWNVTDPAHPILLGQPLTGHTGWVEAVVFSPDGRTLASGGQDQTVRLWGMNVDQAIRRVCATTTNILTPAKWAQYVSQDLPYDPPCS